jgi:RNA polymerase sigma-70 factor (ECF subfamily)
MNPHRRHGVTSSGRRQQAQAGAQAQAGTEKREADRNGGPTSSDGELVSTGCDAIGVVRVSHDVDHEEAHLVAAAVDGDESAFRHLVDRHYDACLRYATRMLGNRPDAEDVVQETFVRVYRSLGKYRENGRFRGWLFRILVNRCRSAASARSRRRRLARRSVDLADTSVSAQAGPLLPVSTSAVESALRALPAAQREAFLLKCVEEWTYDEMAELTGANVSALKMRVSRARDTLRARLGGEATDEQD